MPAATAATGISFQAPSACRTVAVSGAASISLRMALRARSSDSASIISAIENSTITIAASGHWPMITAPVTAIAIRALMLRLKLRSAIKPFL